MHSLSRLKSILGRLSAGDPTGNVHAPAAVGSDILLSLPYITLRLQLQLQQAPARAKSSSKAVSLVMFLTRLTRLWVCADGYIAGFRIIKSSSARGTAHDRFQLWLRAQHSSDTTGQPLGKQAWDGMRSVQRSKDIPLPPHFSAEHRMMGSCEQVLAWLWGYSWMHISHVPSKYQGPRKVAKGFRVLRVTCSWYLSGQGHAASSPSISLGCLALPCPGRIGTMQQAKLGGNGFSKTTAETNGPPKDSGY